ncbi:MAG TPA: hypothetical protein PLS50_04630 [Candidatus Dojkabacteria bacterium]|nr:hypothetical protein [Candidatus Dojkabacteria bacterium]
MQKSRIIHVNSRYRDTGTYDNFTLSINEPPLKYSSVKLLDVSIPQSFYNFTSSNNVITFQEGGTGTVYTATITPGAYGATTLTTELTTQLNAAGGTGTYTATYNTNQNTYTIAADVSFEIFFSNSNSPWYRLGFNNSDTGVATSHTSSNSVNLAPDNYVYIQINGLGLPKIQTASSQNVSSHFTVPLNGISNTVSPIILDDHTLLLGDNMYHTSGQVTIKLLNEQGNLVGLRGDWAFSLMLLI